MTNDEGRMSKSAHFIRLAETISKSEYSKFKTKLLRNTSFWSLIFRSLEFVSNFDIRISNFPVSILGPGGITYTSFHIGLKIGSKL